jgi:hypothetical protein
MTSVKKLREVFVLHSVTERNLSQFFKIPSSLVRNFLGKQVVKTGENGFFCYFGQGGFGGGKVVFRPPWGGK